MRDLKVLHREQKALICLFLSLPFPCSLSWSLFLPPICLHISLSISLFILLKTHTHTYAQNSHSLSSGYGYITTGKGLIMINFDLACIKLWCYLNCVPRCLDKAYLQIILKKIIKGLIKKRNLQWPQCKWLVFFLTEWAAVTLVVSVLPNIVSKTSVFLDLNIVSNS